MKPQTWIIACILGVSLSSALAQAPATLKTWTFALPHGTLSVELQSNPNGMSSLHIGPIGRGLEAPISEQVEPLKKVLHEMTALGWDPHKLSYLSTRLFGQDVREKLAYACVDSRDWHLSMQNKGRDKEKIVIALLNQSGAYEPYNKAFNSYGILVQVSEAEKVRLIYFSSLPRRNSRDRSYAKTRVPGDAMLSLQFSNVDPTLDEKALPGM
jgi:hypothetical protein